MRMLASILIAITLSGCVAIPYPHRVTDLPETQGTIVDGQTGKPIPNFAVTISKFQNRQYFRGNVICEMNNDPDMQKTVRTDQSGKFVFSEESHWKFFKFLWLGPIDFLYLCSELCLTYQLDSSGEPLHFDDKQSHSFAFRPVYNPHIIIGDNSSPRYGPIIFDVLRTKTPNQPSEVVH